MTNIVSDPIYRAPSIPIGRLVIEALNGLPTADFVRQTGLAPIYHSREVSRIALQLAAVLQIEPEQMDIFRLCCEFTAYIYNHTALEAILNRIKSNNLTPTWNPKTRRIITELFDYQLANLLCEHELVDVNLSEYTADIHILWQNSLDLEFRYNPKYQCKYVLNAPIYRLFTDANSSGIVYIGENSSDVKQAFSKWANNSSLYKLYPGFEVQYSQDNWWDLSVNSTKPILCVGHFDAHGYSAAGVTYNSLRNLGANVELYLGYCKTGELGRFWKRTFIDLLKSDKYDFIILHDLTIDSRHPSRTAYALEQVQNYKCKVVMCDHHQDTALYISHLIEPNVRIYLSDAAGCQLPPTLTQSQRDYAIAGAETDKEWHLPVPEISTLPESGGNHKMDQWIKTLSNFIKYPKTQVGKLEDDLAISAGDLVYNIDDLVDPSWLVNKPDTTEVDAGKGQNGGFLQLSSSIKLTDLKYKFEGRVVVFTERPPTSGRTWYQLMEDVMNVTKLEENQSDPAFVYVRCPYAIAFRLVNPKMFNILLLTHWAEPAAIPIGHFIPNGYTSVGYISACWCDVAVNELSDFIEKVVGDINSVYPETTQQFLKQ